MGVFGDVIQDELIESFFDIGVMLGIRLCSSGRVFAQVLEEVLAVDTVFFMFLWVFPVTRFGEREI